jgi:hypothetical protein
LVELVYSSFPDDSFLVPQLEFVVLDVEFASVGDDAKVLDELRLMLEGLPE